ncbi:thiamine pyrophosphate-binding protein [bacterium]|nr:thiamine pyrophosphate-binding protein [bacterium]
MEYPVRLLFADILIEAGIDHVFGIPGGNTPFIFDGFVDKKDKIKTILVRHEGGASVMADMHARITGKPAVVVGQGPFIATSGGFGILESFYSGLPMIIICDTSDYFSLPLHGPYQNGTGDYGAADVPAMLKAMTKFTTVATNPTEFMHGLQLAIKHATTGRPGPAAVVIRWNVPFENIDLENTNPKYFPIAGYLRNSPPHISQEDANKAADLLVKAQNPVMVIGQGVRSAKAYDEVVAIAELLGMPVATSYLGKSAIAETHDCAVGMMGGTAQKITNQKITGADVILAVGTSLAPDNTKWLARDYINAEKQKIIHIDIESLNAGWTFPVEMGITSDAKIALKEIIASIKQHPIKVDAKKRVETLMADKKESRYFDEEAVYSDETPIAPERVVKELNDIMNEDDLLILDAGNARLWCCRHFQSKQAGQVLAGGGAAAIGYGTPAAISAQITEPNKRVVCVTGDGGFSTQLYALEHAKDLKLPVTYVIMNNSCLGNIHDYQAPDRKIASEYSTMNCADIARGFGLKGVRVDDPKDLKAALKEAIESTEAVLVEVMTKNESHFKLMG